MTMQTPSTSTHPQTDQEWHDLASSTLSAFRSSVHPSYEAPKPGTAAFASTVDHTLLKLDADEGGIRKCCEEAREWGFKAVCVRSYFVALARKTLPGTLVDVCSVVCFPEGTQTVDEKVKEGKIAVDAGAKELDYVINYLLIQKGSYEQVLEELQTLRATFPSMLLKIILETSQLNDHAVVAACLLAAAASLDFVKTSTGFRGHGATEHHVRLMRFVVESKGMGVKASGGIRTAEAATSMLRAGSTRLGLSGSVAIMQSPQA